MLRKILLAGVTASAFVAATAITVAQAPDNTSQEATMQSGNPLLANWEGPFDGVPAFDKVTPELFGPAFEKGIAERQAEVDAIAANKAAANFENTIAAMERAGRTLDRVENVFGVMTSNMNSDAYQALDAEWSPKLAAAADKINFNEALFKRVEAVYGKRSKLAPDRQRLVKRYYDGFVRRGAKLSAENKEKMAAINQELASLFTEFGNKVLADENTWTVLASKKDLAGLPDSVIASAKAAADQRGLKGKWAIVNTRSSVAPFLAFSDRRDLREKVWRAFVNRGDNGDANDTNAAITRIVKLRAERAKLLGYPTHADWRMSDTMAKSPAKAMDLMMRVWKPAVARVHEEVADMQTIAGKEGAGITLEPWDYRYYAEKVRKAKYDLDEAEIKPYFELNNMINAAFWAAEQLYGMTFVEITGTVPVWEPGVRVWEVKNKATGNHIGVFYGDYFARAGKRSGAWMTSYRIYETFDGNKTPLVSNNNNFVKGAPGEPVLISLDDAETLFHEFGHALHYLSVHVAYPTQNFVPRDFVEYPSQVNEHWVLTREVLDKFARHYKTGEAMPQALVDKIKASEKFNQGFATVEYLAAAIVDMNLHTMPDGTVDPDAYEREDLERLDMPKEIVLRHRLPQFLHLFSSDAYSAGYYSYLWSEVMDADTWKAFEEAGSAYDKPTAERFQKWILATGDSIDQAEAFRQFRGRDPDVNALLEVRGFPTEGASGGAGGSAQQQ